jgi:hypothetical protein
MTPVLKSAQSVSEDGGHFSLSWGLHPYGAFLECTLRIGTNFGRI